MILVEICNSKAASENSLGKWNCHLRLYVMCVDQGPIKSPHCAFSVAGTTQGVGTSGLLVATSFSAQIILQQIIIQAFCLLSLEDLIYPNKHGVVDLLDLKRHIIYS